MDAPDATVRLAMMKMLNPAGMPPMTQEEAQRLSTRMYLEGQSAKNVPTSAQTMQMRQAGPVDVNSYAGSMWAAPGSYTAARPTQIPSSTMEQRADAILKQRFGEMLPGQTMREAGMRDEWMVPAQQGAPEVRQLPQTGAGSFISALKQPSGLESLLGYQFNAGGSAAAGSPLVQPMASQGAPSARPSANILPTQTTNQGFLPGYKTPSPAVLQQMLANAQPQAPSFDNMTVAQTFGMTPTAQTLGMERSRFAAQTQKDKEKTLMDTATSMMASGQDVSGLGLTPSQMARVRTDASLLSEKGQRTVETVNEKGQAIKNTYDITGNLIASRPIERPVLSVEEQIAAERGKTIAKGDVEGAQKRLEGNTAAFNSAIASENAAQIAEKGILSPTTTTGFGANLASYFKRSLAAAGLDTGVTEQEFAQKGLAAMQASGIAAVMKGLGSMSDADREFAAKQFPQITDSKRSILFYIEMAKENAKFAREDAALQRSMQKRGIDPVEIANVIDERRQSRNVVQDAYDRAMKREIPVAPAAGKGAPKGQAKLRELPANIIQLYGQPATAAP